eukprot:928074-Alexandrium_andersonii.AAC.1
MALKDQAHAVLQLATPAERPRIAEAMLQGIRGVADMYLTGGLEAAPPAPPTPPREAQAGGAATTQDFKSRERRATGGPAKQAQAAQEE